MPACSTVSNYIQIIHPVRKNRQIQLYVLTGHSWRVMIDATTGNVIKKENYTIPDSWNKKKKQGAVENRNSDYGVRQNYFLTPLDSCPGGCILFPYHGKHLIYPF